MPKPYRRKVRRPLAEVLERAFLDLRGKSGLTNTPTEQKLTKYVEATFLGPWSHPSIYYKKSRGSEEVGDVVAIFDNDVVIFEDKNIAYHTDKPVEISWPRWYREAVKESARQLYRAEGRLRNYPDRLYLDRRCAEPFPKILPPSKQMQVHRVAVVHGITKAHKVYRDGEGSGGLSYLFRDIGDSAPFTLGLINPNKGFIHVFDELSFSIMLSVLNTPEEFVRYLSRKEKAVLSGKLLGSAGGEENLLYLYFQGLGPDGHNDFIVPEKYVGIAAGSDLWEKMRGTDAFRRRILADEPSYLWDLLIHFFGDGIFLDPSDPRFGDAEKKVRLLAREPRHGRRVIVKEMVRRFEEFSGGETWFAIESSANPLTLYVFTFTENSKQLEREVYKRKQFEATREAMNLVFAQRLDARHIIGICIDVNGDPDGIYIGVLEIDKLELKDYEELAKLKQENPITFDRKVIHEKNFPDT